MGMMASLRVLNRGPMFSAPLRAMAPHKPTLFGSLAIERWVAVARSVDHRLKTLAQLRASSLIGCLW